MFVSEALAIASATCIALSAMLIGRLKGRLGIFRLTRWQMLSAFPTTACVATLVGGWQTVAQWQIGLLVASSLCGMVIGALCYSVAIYTVGPRATALMFSLTSPFALALGYLVFGETINLQQSIGIVLVLSGVALAINAEAPPGSPRLPKARGDTRIWLGIGCGIVMALLQAVSNLLSRPAMAAGLDPFAAMAIRSGFAATLFVCLAAFPFARADQGPPATTRTVGITVVSAFFGTSVGMSLLMAALATGDVGVVSTLSSTAPVAILPMVWLQTGVAPAPVAWLGALLAIVGIGLISI